MSSFEEIARGLTSEEILNYYRNCFYTEPNHTERGIVAWAINDILPKYVQYRDAEEQGLLLRLPCHYNDILYWVINDVIREVWFKGIRCDKGYKPQIIARYIVNLASKEEPITKLENFGKTVFLTREEAEKALADMKGGAV